MISSFKERLQIINDYIEYSKSVRKSDNYFEPRSLEASRQCKLDLITREKWIKKNLTPRYTNVPYSVQLELTSKCNQKCIHCYNQSGMDKNASNNDMSFEKWIEVAKELADMQISQVIISGGEPTTLGNRLFKLMDILHEIGSQFIFITNGLLINKENIKRLAKYRYAWMQFSVDGSTEEMHDYIRGKEGSFRKVIKAICLARSHGVPVGMASVFIKKNVDQVGELVDLAYNLGAYKIVCGNFMYAGRAVKNATDLELSEVDLYRIDDIIAKKQIEYYGLMGINKPLDPAMSLRVRISQRMIGLLIRPDGEVRIDCQAPIRIGNVLENTVKDIWGKYGRTSWEHKKTLAYIKKVKDQNDLLSVNPRTHFDPDIDLTKLV